MWSLIALIEAVSAVSACANGANRTAGAASELAATVRAQVFVIISRRQMHFALTLQTQRELAELTSEESTTKAKLLQLQASITPHLEILHKEQTSAEIILKKDPNMSTLDGLVYLAAETAIQHKTLEVALKNWDEDLKMIMQVNSTFLATYGLNP